MPYELPSNWKLLEQNVVADIYYNARKRGIKLILELRLPTSQFRKGNCRADLALVENVGDKKYVLAVIEVKRSLVDHDEFIKRKEKRRGKQFLKYKELEDNFGVEVFWANRKTDIDKLVKSLIKIRDRFIIKKKKLRSRLEDGLP
jgi:hypothetical protein